MTERQTYENVLVELNKVKAPSLHLEDLNYFANKGIQEYVNERYSLYETTQQLTDDLQALNSSVNTVITVPTPFVGNLNINYSGSFNGSKIGKLGNKYNSGFLQTVLPDNYLHLLNCVASVKTNLYYKCDPIGYIHSSNAKRLTSDIGAGVMNNAFLKPNYKRPYYNITDDYVTGSKVGAIQIFYGDPTKFTLNNFSIDYLKQPTIFNLTISQRDSVSDTSHILEFPEYVCNEIIKRILRLILENQQNQRLQTNIPINQTIK